MRPYFNSNTGIWEHAEPFTEYKKCEQCNCEVPAETINKLQINVCNDCLGEYYKNLVESEDVNAISEYHEYVLANPSLLNR